MVMVAGNAILLNGAVQTPIGRLAFPGQDRLCFGWTRRFVSA